ncbi:MAG: carotenoid biosynthesis protein [Chitinophagales bacterium]|jgi:putative membrane protein|nr:carotenoid biosynthesis protein [Sphingobacteriales bacterium]
MNIWNSIEKSAISIFAIWLVTISGIIGICLGYTEWFISKTPYNLILGVGLLYWNFPLKNGWRSLAIWSIVFAIGMGAELIGVNTGLLFGEYHYGENLGVKVFGVPILIGINWVVLTFLTAHLSNRYIQNKWLAILCGSILMVALDFFIEPTAPIFDFWHWESGYPPFRNFVDWFVISLILQVVVVNDLHEEPTSFPIHHLVSQFVFFVFFYVFYQL